MDNKTNPLITIVIPVYQAEKTIKRCISSIISSKAEIEIICVDDGSKDDSLAILQDLAKQNNRLTVIHQENAGAGAARNKGLSVAHGDYIMFCDADDMYLNNTVDLIADDINRFNADYLVFRRKIIKLDGEVVYWGNGDSPNILNCEWYDYFNNYILPRRHGFVVFTKVFKNNIIKRNNIRFENFKFGEDVWFILTYLIHAKSFIEDFRICYQQYVTEDSIVQSSYNNRFELNIECLKKFASSYPSEAELIKPFIIDYKMHCLTFSQEFILKGPDGSSFKEKLKLSKILFSKKEVKNAISQYLELHPDMSYINKKMYNDILHGNYFTFYFFKYLIPGNIKKTIKNLIAIFIPRLHK